MVFSVSLYIPVRTAIRQPAVMYAMLDTQLWLPLHRCAALQQQQQLVPHSSDTCNEAPAKDAPSSPKRYLKRNASCHRGSKCAKAARFAWSSERSALIKLANCQLLESTRCWGWVFDAVCVCRSSAYLVHIYIGLNRSRSLIRRSG